MRLHPAGIVESRNVPIRRARSVISVLSIVSRGRRIGISVAMLVTPRFRAVWEDFWPIASPVTIPVASSSRAICSATRYMNCR